MSADVARRVNLLRAQRAHLEAQVEAGVDTQHGTLGEAEEALDGVNTALAAAEEEARAVSELAYLFRRGRSKTGLKAGIRTRVPSPQSDTSEHDTKEDSMARKSKAAQLEETLEALRKAEKNAGSTKWALSGKGAEKNPPSPERKAHLTDKLAREQALVAELRAKRDELKG